MFLCFVNHMRVSFDWFEISTRNPRYSWTRTDVEITFLGDLMTAWLFECMKRLWGENSITEHVFCWFLDGHGLCVPRRLNRSLPARVYQETFRGKFHYWTCILLVSRWPWIVPRKHWQSIRKFNIRTPNKYKWSSDHPGIV